MKKAAPKKAVAKKATPKKSVKKATAPVAAPTVVQEMAMPMVEVSHTEASENNTPTAGA